MANNLKKMDINLKKMLTFLHKYQHYLGGYKHDEPFNEEHVKQVDEYIYGLGKNGKFLSRNERNKTNGYKERPIRYNGHCLTDSLIYAGHIQGNEKLKDKLVDHFETLYGSGNTSLMIDGIPVGNAREITSYLSYDAIKMASLYLETNICVFDLTHEPLNIRYFYNTKTPPNRILHIVKLNAHNNSNGTINPNMFVPLKRLLESNSTTNFDLNGHLSIALSDQTFSVACLTLIQYCMDSKKSDELDPKISDELDFDISDKLESIKIYIDNDNDIIDLYCRIDIFERVFNIIIQNHGAPNAAENVVAPVPAPVFSPPAPEFAPAVVPFAVPNPGNILKTNTRKSTNKGYTQNTIQKLRNTLRKPGFVQPKSKNSKLAFDSPSFSLSHVNNDPSIVAVPNPENILGTNTRKITNKGYTQNTIEELRRTLRRPGFVQPKSKNSSNRPPVPPKVPPPVPPRPTKPFNYVKEANAYNNSLKFKSNNRTVQSHPFAAPAAIASNPFATPAAIRNQLYYATAFPAPPFGSPHAIPANSTPYIPYTNAKPSSGLHNNSAQSIFNAKERQIKSNEMLAHRLEAEERQLANERQIKSNETLAHRLEAEERQLANERQIKSNEMLARELALSEALAHRLEAEEQEQQIKSNAALADQLEKNEAFAENLARRNRNMQIRY